MRRSGTSSGDTRSYQVEQTLLVSIVDTLLSFEADVACRLIKSGYIWICWHAHDPLGNFHESCYGQF